MKLRRGSRRVKPTRLTVVDLVGEAVTGVLSRPGRAVLTMLGVVLGVGTFVAVLGLTTTASGQISQRFTILAATEVTVKPTQQRTSDGGVRDRPVFPANVDAKAGKINGVNHAGASQVITGAVGGVTGVPLPGAREAQIPVISATPGYLRALRAQVSLGRLFDDGHVQRTDPVVILGRTAARRLGISRIENQPVVFLGGNPFTVIGIIDDVRRNANVLSSIVVPRSTASALWPELNRAGGPGGTPEMIVDTELGAAPVVAEQLAVAIRPEDPSALTVVPPPDPQSLRDTVENDLNSLFVLLAAVSLVIGTVGIANTTLVAVLERTGEIGLRRALGARRRHIAAQFLAESALVGTTGGVVGAALGVLAIVGAALAQRWTPILEPVAVLPAPVVGTFVGVIAGLYPATKAASIPPAEAFRR